MQDADIDASNVRRKKKLTRFNRSPVECIHYLCPLYPTRQRMRNNWSFYTTFPREKKERGGVRESKLQETPDHSPVLPLIYLPLLSAGLLRVRQYFHIVLLNTMWAYLLLSPQTAIAYLQRQFAQPLAGLKRPIEAPLDEIWSCQRVWPPNRGTQLAAECVCVLDKWPNVILSNVLYCLSIHECCVKLEKCVLYLQGCVCMCRSITIFLPISYIVVCLWRVCVYAHVAQYVCMNVLYSHQTPRWLDALRHSFV